MPKSLRIGTRSSPLALKQIEEIRRLFRWIKFQAVTFETAGDKDKTTPLERVEDSDFFTREIDAALLAGEIDLALHSAKDLPRVLPAGLKIIFETESLSPFEALVSRGDLELEELPAGARVGISSQRRRGNIKFLRPDLEVVAVRGNIQERLALVESSRIDALIVAYAALKRLGLEKKAAQIFTPDVFPGHPKQGRLSLMAREDKWQEVRSILSAQARATGN